MPIAKTYHHYCPVARSLEVIGEKWTLLVVRDLLRGPLRFSDLLRYLGGITPKWLTARLRDLEQVGIVEREAGHGREVWYRLTSRGEALRPVIEGLAAWGIDFAMRPPLPEEPLFPEQMLSSVAAYLNHYDLRAAAPRRWRLLFDGREPLDLCFDGRAWSSTNGDRGTVDVTVRTTPERWIAFLLGGPGAGAPNADRVQVAGAAVALREFRTLVRRAQQRRRQHIAPGPSAAPNSAGNRPVPARGGPGERPGSGVTARRGRGGRTWG